MQISTLTRRLGAHLAVGLSYLGIPVAKKYIEKIRFEEAGGISRLNAILEGTKKTAKGGKILKTRPGIDHVYIVPAINDDDFSRRLFEGANLLALTIEAATENGYPFCPSLIEAVELLIGSNHSGASHSTQIRFLSENWIHANDYRKTLGLKPLRQKDVLILDTSLLDD